MVYPHVDEVILVVVEWGGGRDVGRGVLRVVRGFIKDVRCGVIFFVVVIGVVVIRMLIGVW